MPDDGAPLVYTNIKHGWTLCFTRPLGRRGHGALLITHPLPPHPYRLCVTRHPDAFLIYLQAAD
eukprot:6974-Pyramimonas_sp.AAC.1